MGVGVGGTYGTGNDGQLTLNEPPNKLLEQLTE